MSVELATARVMEDLPSVQLPEEPQVELFRRWNAADLLALPRKFEWDIKGVTVRGTHGMVAGEKKSLKSYTSLFMSIAKASGQPLFGRFAVPEAGPVLYYVGEGGQAPFADRLERQARAMGVNASELPIYTTFDTAPVLSDRFRLSLERDLADLQPSLVVIDPYYAYHGATVSAQNLHEEGALLNALSEPCVEAGATLKVVNHFNKSGTGRGLDRLTMAGGQEWVDSWWLLSHREAPRVSTGEFKLLLDIGSRRWGGGEWELDLTLGSFDVDLGQHVGEITWEIRRASENDDREDTRSRILAVVAEEPFSLTKEELAERVGGRRIETRRLIDLLADSILELKRVPRLRSDGHSYKAWTYALASQAGRDGTTDEAAV